MTKRVRIKGQGADIFLGGNNPASQQTTKPSKQYAGNSVEVSKATFYLPVNLIEDLEDTWLSLRGKYKDKRVAKSEIARIALEEIIKGWKEKQDNSILVKRLTDKYR
ncbi:hypothetical protein ES695_02665 [Candidatus Atribacteria bacterium 1244-E10-H5-B2]|jgi:hypothetical protein|nr:MAG: hypothetical protein ES695_02665 [Candidatus Atribacteria bacterium 1244-E10-H5-B2]